MGHNQNERANHKVMCNYVFFHKGNTFWGVSLMFKIYMSHTGREALGGLRLTL